MSKITISYWNPLSSQHQGQWEIIEHTNSKIEQIILTIDSANGDFTRLTRFKAGADTKSMGAQIHDYPEEIFIVSGRLYDQTFEMWLESGHYSSRPAGEKHGPFHTDTECIVLDCSYPSQTEHLSE